MKNIIDHKDIYPHEGKILEHFGEMYKSAFIAFLPFFKVGNHYSGNENLKKSKKITFQQAQDELDILKGIPEPNATIYAYTNKDYPSDEEVYKNGEIVTWEKIVSESDLQDYSDLSKALLTSIGARRKIFARPDLAEKLDEFTIPENIWHPLEGRFDVFSKVAIYKAFKLLNKNEIIVTDEFYDDVKTIFLDELSEWEFVEKIDFKDYYIYSKDQELLFTIEWDSFFFIIGSRDSYIEKIISEELFHGFICTTETEHEWDYEKGEVERLLKLEKESENKKKWWVFWK